MTEYDAETIEWTPGMIDHDARMMFDVLMSDLTGRGIEEAKALAAVRRIARDGNGWA